MYERNGLRTDAIAALQAMHQSLEALSPGNLGIGASIMRTPTGVAGMSDPRVHGRAEGSETSRRE